MSSAASPFCNSRALLGVLVVSSSSCSSSANCLDLFVQCTHVRECIYVHSRRRLPRSLQAFTPCILTRNEKRETGVVPLAFRVCLGSSALALGLSWAVLGCPGPPRPQLLVSHLGVPAIRLVALASVVLVVLVPPGARSASGPGARWQRPGCSWPAAASAGQLQLAPGPVSG